MNPEFYGLIFCQTKREVTEITEWLKRKSFKVDCIHGDRPQRERDFILQDFRKGRVKILVATDVAARGLDINDLTRMINFRYHAKLKLTHTVSVVQAALAKRFSFINRCSARSASFKTHSAGNESDFNKRSRAF